MGLQGVMDKLRCASGMPLGTRPECEARIDGARRTAHYVGAAPALWCGLRLRAAGHVGAAEAEVGLEAVGQVAPPDG